MLRVPLLKNQKCLHKSTLYAETNHKLTSPYILSLLSLNCYTCIAGTVTLRILSKQRTPRTIHVKTASQNTTIIACTEDFAFLSIRRCQSHCAGRGISLEVFQSPFAPESWPFHVKEFLPTVFQHSIGSHCFFSTCRFPFSS